MRTFHFRRMNLRLLLALAIIAILATAAYGFAAGNTVNPSKAGDGDGDITGYTVSNIHYQLDTENPSLIAGVTFDLDAGATTVKAQLTDSGAWYNCSPTNNTSTSWSCTAPDAGSETTVASADPLRVVAAQ